MATCQAENDLEGLIRKWHAVVLLRHNAASRKYAGSKPNEVIGFYKFT
jgi:hypothetical protein